MRSSLEATFALNQVAILCNKFPPKQFANCQSPGFNPFLEGKIWPALHLKKKKAACIWYRLGNYMMRIRGSQRPNKVRIKNKGK